MVSTWNPGPAIQGIDGPDHVHAGLGKFPESGVGPFLAGDFPDLAGIPGIKVKEQGKFTIAHKPSSRPLPIMACWHPKSHQNLSQGQQK
jgi:hypothetical protein